MNIKRELITGVVTYDFSTGKARMIYENTKDFINHIQKGQKLICFDLGAVRIGIALSDLEHIIASPHSVYTRKNISKDMGYLAKLIKDEKVSAIVVGLPLELDGSEGDACEKTRAFATKLYKKINLPILLQDERFSTAEATKTLYDSGINRRQRHSIDDKLAASYILRTVLDKINYES